MLFSAGTSNSADLLFEFKQKSNEGQDVLEFHVTFMGHVRSTRDICRYFSSTLREQIFTEVLTDEIIRQNILKYPRFELATSNIPMKPTWYIPRSILVRSDVARMVLDDEKLRQHWNPKIKDQLCFVGVAWSKVSTLATKSLTQRSSQVLQHGRTSSNFVYLDNIAHAEQIHERFELPVHVIQFCSEHNEFVLEKSFGARTEIQKFLKSEFSNCSEKTFTERLAVDNQTQCIVDTAGVGKSVLLAEFARYLQTKSIVIHVAFRDIFHTELHDEAPTLQTIFSTIAACCSRHPLGQKLVLGTLMHEKVYLLIDGFDELNPDEIHTAKEILIRMQQENLIQLIISSRPHMQYEMESVFGVKCCFIAPFSTTNQIDFLFTNWKEKALKNQSMVPEDCLKEFAEICVNSMKHRLKDYEQDIFGVPLQCLLLASVYYENAVAYRPCAEFGYDFKLHQLPELYRMYFKKCLGTASAEIKDLHVYHAIAVLFPLLKEKFEGTLARKQTTLHATDLFKFGILEQRMSRNSSITFVHRTFAEYIVGSYLGSNWKPRYRPFIFDMKLELFNRAVATRPSPHTFISAFNHNQPLIHSFVFSTVAFFIDFCLNNDPGGYVSELQSEPRNANKMKRIVPKFFRNKLPLPSLIAAVAENLHSLSRFILENFFVDYYSSSEDLFNVAALKSARETYFLIHDQLSTTTKIKWCERSFTPLHASIISSDLNLFEFLLKDENFAVSLGDFSLLVHYCVNGTLHDEPECIRRKIEILKLLRHRSWACLSEIDPMEGRSPLLMDKIHPDLLMFLLSQGTNVLTQTKSCGSTFLHKVVEYLSPTELNLVIQSISDNDISKLLVMKNNNGRTPLECRIDHLSSETVEKLNCILLCQVTDDVVLGEQGNRFKKMFDFEPTGI